MPVEVTESRQAVLVIGPWCLTPTELPSNEIAVGVALLQTMDKAGLPLLFLALSVVSFIVLYLPYLFVRRSNAVAAAGELQLKVVRPGVRLWRRTGQALCFVLACFGVAAVLGDVLAAPEGGVHLLPSTVSLVLVPVLLAIAELANRFVDPFAVEIRENGIVHSVWFSPWNAIRSYRWTGGKSPTLIVQTASYGFIRFGVLGDQRKLAQSLLQEHVASAIARK